MNIGRKVFRYQSVTSTNEVLKGLAQEGTEAGTAVISAVQTKGRGRLDRKWESPEGGLWLSILVDAGSTLFEGKYGLIPLMTGCAVASAIKGIAGLEARVKWPNDVLIGGRKVCGILGEFVAVGEKRMAVVGIGLNVNNRVQEGYDFSDSSTSLIEEAGNEYELESFEGGILQAFDERLSRTPSEILQEWRSMSDTLGRRVRVLTSKTKLDGLAMDIDQTGALIILFGEGKTATITTGDCQHV